MGRIRKFCREDVLDRALPVFWEQGYAHTSIQDLERATQVNKSGLYAEFEGKDDLFLSTLKYYYERRQGRFILATEPLGWHNIEAFLKIGRNCQWGKGCFAVNSFRELPILPPEARELVEQNWARLKGLVTKNVAAEKTNLPPERIADIFQTLFFGYCVERNFIQDQEIWLGKADDLMGMLKSL